MLPDASSGLAAKSAAGDRTDWMTSAMPSSFARLTTTEGAGTHAAPRELHQMA